MSALVKELYQIAEEYDEYKFKPITLIPINKNDKCIEVVIFAVNGEYVFGVFNDKSSKMIKISTIKLKKKGINTNFNRLIEDPDYTSPSAEDAYYYIDTIIKLNELNKKE